MQNHNVFFLIWSSTTYGILDFDWLISFILLTFSNIITIINNNTQIISLHLLTFPYFYYLILLDFTWFYLILLDFTWFYLILLNFTYFYLILLNS